MSDNRKRALFLPFTLAIMFACATTALACSCEDPSTRKKFRAADAVFLGRVVEVAPNDDRRFAEHPYRVRFAVEKSWKGGVGREASVVSHFDRPGSCGDLKFTPGESYLIYAEREKGVLVIYIDCGPNRRAADAAAEIRKLNGFVFRLAARLSPF
ncbi:MAG TPA: hypothetical protein VD968_16515 [Pyrinomonadaceae bacterium]|nr:hypothetical protein [Pyrinomonadaceae bacterium]